MEKTKIIIISLEIVMCIILGYIVYSIFQPDPYYIQERECSLFIVEDRAFIHHKILNNHEQDLNYTCITFVNNSLYYNVTIFVPTGKYFDYQCDFYKKYIGNANVTFFLYKEGDAIPIEKITYPNIFKLGGEMQ